MENKLFDVVYEVVAEELGSDKTLHRNVAPSTDEPPYTIITVSDGQDTYPTKDISITIRYYEDGEKSVRSLSDTVTVIENRLNHQVLNVGASYAHLLLVNHTYFKSEEYLDLSYYESVFNIRIY